VKKITSERTRKEEDEGISPEDIIGPGVNSILTGELVSSLPAGVLEFIL